MVIMEPVQNSGGTFTPHPEYHRRVREICDAYGVLQVADEVICGFGRLGEWFGCQRYGYEPDLITCAKGLTSGYASLGALLISDRVAEPFVERGEYYLHGITFGGHPMATAIASANLDVMERLDLLANVRANEAYFAEQLHGLAGDHEIIGDVRGAGYFMSLELVKDRATRETFSAEECQVLLREFLSPQLQEAGVICRADDRGDPVIQLSPPLICTREHIDEAVRALDSVLPRAQKLMRGEADGAPHARARRRCRRAAGPSRTRRPATSTASSASAPTWRRRRSSTPTAAASSRGRTTRSTRCPWFSPAAPRRAAARPRPRLALARAHAAPQRLRDDARRGLRGGRRRLPRAAARRVRARGSATTSQPPTASCTGSATRTASRSGTASAWSAASTASSSAASSAASRCSTAPPTPRRWRSSTSPPA